jgi:soluble lytic murein transglycosylase
MRPSAKIKILVLRGIGILSLLLMLAFSLQFLATAVRSVTDGGTIRQSLYDPIIREAATRHGIPPDLVRAVIRQESGFQPRVVGNVGEIGLMQITPNAARDWCTAHGVEYRFRGMLSDPRFNIEVGTWYLARGLKRWQGFKDAEVMALVEYNAGRKRALDWAPEEPGGNALDNVEISSTKAYIINILGYRDLYAGKGGQKR